MYKKNLSNDQSTSLDLKKQFVKGLDISDFFENLTLFSNKIEISNIITRIKLYEMSRGVPGDIFECGVHKGASFILFYHLMSIFEPYSFNKNLIGFDTFEGFRSLNSDKDGDELNSDMFSDCDMGRLEELIKINDLDRPLSHVERCRLIKGDATRTIPKYLQENPETIVSLLYIDFDIYEPTLSCLQNVIPHMPKGAIVVLDEFNSKKWKGETLAIKDYVDINKIKIKRFNFSPQTAYFKI
jgi:hypothetical protein